MRPILVLLALIATACTPAQIADVKLACMVDGSAQPIAASVLATVVPQASIAVSVDNALVHPAVVAYCKSLGGAPVAVAAQ